MNTFYRGRRLRRNQALRTLMQDVSLSSNDLIMPYFVADVAEKEFYKPINSMPGQAQYSIHSLLKRVEKAVKAGLKACILFGIPSTKDSCGSQGWLETGIVQRAVKALKSEFPNLIVVTDVCLCEYTAHGHCGVLSPNGEVLNDPTLELLSKVALSHAIAGADIVAPSDMMDGRVAAIRHALDQQGFENLAIMSYAVKYASSFYGPFREAAESAPQSGDRKSYQMDFANSSQALLEAEADVNEGADILMVKPIGAYLDILRLLHDNFSLPLAAYQVSGEYSMIKAAAEKGWINEEAVILESLIGIKRAGASLILNYFTEELLLKGLVK
ncbi:porphobilinogen synthase [Desulfovibrio litoralis]|uniref:Delta-aminolevulinic acid dehydratase n=1 Tax=Desulfovibrio litoralis DSM 11393 TaxID=1121455 RepID=A0A1M7T6U4_9BACT|nr:porphobilinogen synthase [Desulfovibrio litoralis]SHN66427.1 porphobilinogen synthase [Desulfovibrio litoralis DSM 11393]